ncbi:MAG: hypothetical protein A2474_06205 [Elusimicrobia bacterium RIFOXYC2_FULL_34_12]|nr:MAG: hypothetical protein A2474_06205 [Elusimicrobia bacterium RIFOXYC2_FULL_34_12]OGS38194.1 MAG: hypothetical protein A2551_03130 [Elusimicrobia bacterium RIFOXYD2_FULL_34_30]
MLYTLSYASGPWTNSSPILRQGLGARPLGMGESFVGLADDISTLQFNPAGLSNIISKEVGATYFKGLSDTGYGNIAYAQPVENNNYLGASITTLQGGEMEINWLDSTGLILEKTETRKAKQDYVITAGYARNFLAKDKLSLGLNIKLISSNLAEESKATAVAIDIGSLYRLLKDKLSIGLAIQNVGTSLKYTGGIASGTESDTLPLTVKLGTAYRFISNENRKLIGVIDINKYLYTDIKLNFGVEYGIREMIFFRTGYRIGYDLDSITLGFGIKHKNAQLDYGFGLMNDINDLHKVSFTLRFGVIEKEEPLTAKQYYQKGVLYYDVGEYSNAIVEFSNALGIDPNYMDARTQMRDASIKLINQLYKKGLDYLNEGKYKEAISQFEQVLESDPLHKESQQKLKEAEGKLKR